MNYGGDRLRRRLDRLANAVNVAGQREREQVALRDRWLDRHVDPVVDDDPPEDAPAWMARPIAATAQMYLGCDADGRALGADTITT